MNEEKIQEKKSDEIYCPSCAKPIKKDAAVCPYCGVQIKEIKVSAETIALTPEQETEVGKKLVSGIKVFYWVVVIILGITLIAVIINDSRIIGESESIAISMSTGGLIFLRIIWGIFLFGVMMALYIIPLVGINKRRAYSVPFTRAMLVLTMFGFPVGTIIGVVLWKRINHPLAKKYLHYGT